jgi:hypothetical protein
MNMHCRPIEQNNAQFMYATKIISFAIKKWSYLNGYLYTLNRKWFAKNSYLDSTSCMVIFI